MKNDLCLVGLNYKTAPVEVREAFALTDPKLLEKDIIPLDDDIRECLILSTCNRVEIVAIADNKIAKERILELWASAVGKKVSELNPYIYYYRGAEAINHLFSVASSLDSMVLGEPQILGQLKDAYKEALDRGSAKVIINRLLHRAFSVAKRVRTETAIASSAVSISYAAIELAKRIFEDMSEVRALLIGAGEMAELAATYLLNNGIKSISVANRTFSRAQELAKEYSGTAVPFDCLLESLSESDIIISSTAAAEPIINAKDMKEVLKLRKHKPMFFIDIAVPRDIDADVNTLDNVYLYDIDDLKDVVEENIAQRRSEALKAEAIVQEETSKFVQWLRSLDLQPTIVDLINRNESIVNEELERTMDRLGPFNQEQENALIAMMTSILKKINHDPIVYLKKNLGETDATNFNINLIRRIFNLDNENIPSHSPAGISCTQRRMGGSGKKTSCK